MKLRRGVSTTALVGLVVAIAMVVGGLSYFIGQSGYSPSMVTSTAATTVTGAGTTSVVTVVVTSTGVATTITSTATATSVLSSTTTTTETSAFTVVNCAGVPGNCVLDADGNGI